MDISFNWRSFAHFLHLRNSEHAQVEVRELAQEMLRQVKNIEGNPFELTIKSFKLWQTHEAQNVWRLVKKYWQSFLPGQDETKLSP